MWLPALTAALFALWERESLREILNLRIGAGRSYLWAATYAVAVGALTVAMGIAFGKLHWNPQPMIHWPSAVATLVVWTFASLGGEIGWRGYLHNQLRGFTHAPLIIGLVWAGWHARSLFVAHTGSTYYMIGVFTGTVILASYFLSWLVERSLSVLVRGFFHGVWNFLWMKLLFGNPEHSARGLFLSDSPMLTEMEGVFGLAAISIVGAAFVHSWYRDSEKLIKNNLK